MNGRLGAALLAVVVCGCASKSSTEASALCSQSDSGVVSSGQLPAGACTGEVTCSVNTHDVCPDGIGFGPVIVWNCGCVAGMWSCTEISEGKAVCRPVDGGTANVDGGTRGVSSS
jgi:hypothetical protein